MKRISDILPKASITKASPTCFGPKAFSHLVIVKIGHKDHGFSDFTDIIKS